MSKSASTTYAYAEQMRHLEEAEEWVRTGADIVARQRRLIDKLAADGHDTTRYQQWLSKFEDVQQSFVDFRAMILRELGM